MTDPDMLEIFMLRPDALTVWEDEEVKKRLSWYHSVMVDEKPAKFLIARRVELEENPYDIADEGELWRIHEKTSDRKSVV